jgi:exosortase
VTRPSTRTRTLNLHRIALRISDKPTRRWYASPSPYAILSVCLLIVAAVHRTTVLAIVRRWNDDPFGHGYFVLPIALYLAINRRERLACTRGPALVGLPVVAVLSLLSLSAAVTDHQTAHQGVVVALLVAVVWTVLGTQAFRLLAFPLGLLWFALPWAVVLAPGLQATTAHVVYALLRIGHVAATLDGNVLSVGDTRWHVAEACGGINYFMASTAIGYLYAGAGYREWRHRLAFVLASMLVPITGNILRVFGTILLWQAGATRLVEGTGHYLFGVVVFAAMTSVLLVTCGRWRDEPSNRTA